MEDRHQKLNKKNLESNSNTWVSRLLESLSSSAGDFPSPPHALVQSNMTSSQVVDSGSSALSSPLVEVHLLREKRVMILLQWYSDSIKDCQILYKEGVSTWWPQCLLTWSHYDLSLWLLFLLQCHFFQSFLFLFLL